MLKYFDWGGVGGRIYFYIKIIVMYIEELLVNKIQLFYYSKVGKYMVFILEFDFNLIMCLYKKKYNYKVYLFLFK